MNTIRTITKCSVKQTIFHIMIFIVAGILFGAFAKFIDLNISKVWLWCGFIEIGSSFIDWNMGEVLELLDISNFLGRLAIYILIGVSISVYSKSPYRASIYSFIFFMSFVSGYYVYTKYYAGFFPKAYAIVWFIIALISPVFAFICWFSVGKGKIAMFISSCIIAIMFLTTFSCGWLYIDIISPLELVTFFAMLLVLRRNYREMLYVVGIGVAIGMVWSCYRYIIPIGIL